MDELITIVGPTGIGKSNLALHLAQEFNGEIVSADSRQVYRYMDIGTAKPTREQLALVPHHLIDIVNPDENFSLAQYQEIACKTIENIHQRDRLALLVGGSGLYIWSVLENWGIPHVPPDMEFRKDLEEKAAIGCGDEIYQELAGINPLAARRIDRRNVRRVIRALEINRSAGNLLTANKRERELRYSTLIIGLTTNREELYHRIDSRVDEMIKCGFPAEVEELHKQGYAPNTPAMSGIGYQEISMFLDGKINLDTATQQIKYETHRFVRHQYAWFKLSDSRIRWFDVQNDVEPEIMALAAQFVRSRS